MPRPFNPVLSLVMLGGLLGGCSGQSPSVTPQLVRVYASAAVRPWLPEFYDCADRTSAVIYLVGPQEAEIQVRVGEPEVLATPAFQIGTEEILIVTHRQSPVQDLTLLEARELFAGLGEPSMQVWVYPHGDDVQAVFDRQVMSGRPVTTSALVVGTPQQMLDAVTAEQNAVGILPGHSDVGDAREVFRSEAVPVLAITPQDPGGVVRELLACIQKGALHFGRI